MVNEIENSVIRGMMITGKIARAIVMVHSSASDTQIRGADRGRTPEPLKK
jgi:hypothetical protein